MDLGDHSDDGDISNIPTRPMRVKILYTFDIGSTTNCLARLPDTRSIPAVSIDEQSQVGIIDLQSCISAVVSASPEILSSLATADFTVYTFDYSEHDTPLLGQGRLSNILASPTSPGGTSTRVTGRVCKNVPALFSNGVKETLEVKLRFMPVPKASQHDFSRNTDGFRSASPATSAGFDPNAWSVLMHPNQVSQQAGEYFDLPLDGVGDTQSLEELLGMTPGASGDGPESQSAGGVGIPETPTDAAFEFSPAFAAHARSAPGSRAGSPMMGSEYSTRNDLLRHQSFSGHSTIPASAEQTRPGSRVSVRSESSPRHPTQNATPSHRPDQLQQQPEVFYNEDGQVRKRVKVTQTDWRGRSQFGGRSADLRVTAATASSMHMHRPIPRRSTGPGSNLEPPPRVPTPVPKRTTLPHQRGQQLAAPRSMLREASAADSDMLSEPDMMSEAVMSSPESQEEHSPGNSVGPEGTPFDMPSSPPVFQEFYQPEPSSPGLPTLPQQRFADSGYMSEPGFYGNKVVQSMEEDENRSPDAEDLEVAKQYQSRNHRQQSFVKAEGSLAGSTSPHHGEIANVQYDSRSGSEQRSCRSTHNPTMERQAGHQNYVPQSRPLHGHRGPPHSGPISLSTYGQMVHPVATSHDGFKQDSAQFEISQSRRNSLALPPQPMATDSSIQGQAQAGQPQRKRQAMRRSHTANFSDACSPAPSDTESRPRGHTRSGSAMPRRKVIAKRLQDSIARGDMPQFCSHCGAIETPTWRKLYVKEVLGKPGPLDAVEGEGETVGIEDLEKDTETGVVTKFIVRKSMKKTKDSQPGVGFKDVVVCNPCGLWFAKFKHMRPQNKWNRRSLTRKKKPKSEELYSTDGVEPTSEAFFTDPFGPEEAVEESGSADDVPPDVPAVPNGESAPVRRPRANSLQSQPPRRSNSGGSNSSGAQFDARAVQSSPVRFQGSQDSPIELDLTPQPTRRLLFPSPRQAGEVKSLDEPLRARRSHSPATEKALMADLIPGPDMTSFDVLKAMTSDKENMPLPLDRDESLDLLFAGSPTALFKTPLPKTPRSQNKSTGSLLKTPTSSSRKRKALEPNHNAANHVDNNDSFTTPSGSRYFLRATPSRLERTPGGRNNIGLGLNGEASPFSRHLMQMLDESTGSGEPAPFTSPSQALFDFSDLPTFTTPGKEMDWKGIDDMLSSEFASYEDETGKAGHGSPSKARRA